MYIAETSDLFSVYVFLKPPPQTRGVQTTALFCIVCLRIFIINVLVFLFLEALMFCASGPIKSLLFA